MTRDELLAQVMALPAEDRAAIVQRLLAAFPELDADGLDAEERRRLDVALEEASREADRGKTRPIEDLLDKLRK